ncbi:MAG: hypothetical protein WCZ20_11190 [Hydrogenophaga sp.]|jgi:hypothetical protein|uniref:hypothetical protein n=1 Tax=Hydrogenophaga sp. TaxID=1904254 RepID=UPI000EDB837C|nr:hypothetical protein [Hydrogenophaga sp.]MDD3785472.1 hypothetical protein [Hydrogenophaga sp.]MDX9968207.1 hypothetical protein [Hydrogenophaga sp.]HAJ12445.1 hypothetical protein [Comamonadaceae bacterium]
MHAPLSALRFVHAGALVLGLAVLPTLAAAQADTAAEPLGQQAGEPRGANEKIERIQHEDAGTRIDELRVGGQTRSITVQPKGGAPRYEVAPARGGDDLSESGSGTSGTTGRSRWRLLNF